MSHHRWPAALLLAGLSLAVGPALALKPIEQLGKSIFFDSNLSINANQSCAACHGPGAGWTGPDSAINAVGAVYEGSIAGRFGNRKPPSSAYATLSPVLHFAKPSALFIGGSFWDGRATGEKLGNPAADQAQGPFLNPLEQALPDAACVVHRVCTASAYPVSFGSVWGADACAISWPADAYAQCAAGSVLVLSPADRAKANENYDRIALSIAAFEGSPESNAFTSKFDHFGPGMSHMTFQERVGMGLFMGKAKCARCHTVAPGRMARSLFTDFTYDNLGIPRNPDNPFYSQAAFNPQGMNWIDLGLGGFLDSRADYKPYAAENLGKHKVPTLRNVDLRPSPGFVKAYGHNGYFKSLKAIVHFYNTRDVKPTCPTHTNGRGYTEAEALLAGCWPAPEVAANVNRTELGDLRLSSEEEDALVAFMKALSDGYAP